MKKKRKPSVELDEETHAMLKQQAHDAGLSMRVYLRLCLIQCKGQSSVKIKDL